MRIFTAIPLPEQVKNNLVALTRGKLPVPYLNLTNAHITLNFLGELTDDEVQKVVNAFPALVGDSRGKIHIGFDKVTAFLGRQIHLTLKPNEELRQLQSDLESGFRKIGFYFKDRTYYPHVKLANMHLDNVMNRDRKLDNFPNEELAVLNFDAEITAIYESKLLLHHAHHKSLAEVKLV